MAEYTALQMKKAVARPRPAAKAQVQEMGKRLLELPGLPGADAADAPGIAITHACRAVYGTARGRPSCRKTDAGTYRQGALALTQRTM